MFLWGRYLTTGTSYDVSGEFSITGIFKVKSQCFSKRYTPFQTEKNEAMSLVCTSKASQTQSLK